jgi:hypothetical protein
VRNNLVARAALVAVLAQACGGMSNDTLTEAPRNERRDEPPERASQHDEHPARQVPHDPLCDQLPPALASYDAITDGVAFSLTLARDARGAWAPAAHLAMPLHHASTIEWERRELLDAHSGVRATVIATGLGRSSIEHEVGRNTWFATYRARIERVCPEGSRDQADAPSE